jgi:hypothetical protein
MENRDKRTSEHAADVLWARQCAELKDGSRQQQASPFLPSSRGRRAKSAPSVSKDGAEDAALTLRDAGSEVAAGFLG